MPEIIDLTGKKFGAWTVLSFAGMKNHGSTWNCLCDCGSTHIVIGCSLRNGVSKRCRPCHHIKISTHGMHTTREYKCWISMIRRCHTVTDQAYPKYGAKGIHVCDSWRESFENFFADMGLAPTDKHTLDRIRNHEGYGPNNCRWATMKEQGNNRGTNVFVEFNGERKTIIQWCESLNLPYSTIGRRISKKKWPAEIAFTKPVRFKAPNGGIVVVP